MRTCPKCQRTYPDDADFCLKDGTPLPSASSVTESELASGLARRYRIVKKLGAGGMGAVFLAEQIALGNRPVALKVLSRRLLDDPEFLLRFHDEGASTARIRHANVVTIYESGQSDDGTPYIAMEYLEGETLRQTLRTRGALPVAECAEILPQIARGLNAAHKLGIIHRDLKPDNIFLTYPDDVGATLVVAPGRAQGPPLPPVVVKLVDFGIAKLRESATHTQTGMVLGTPAYKSYEQASGMRSDELDARSDVYSLGVVGYEMVTGRPPFQSDTPVGYLRMHMQEDPPPFRAVAPGLDVPPQVEAVVMEALKKEREERYQSALEFAHAFVAAALPAPAPEVSQSLPSTKVVLSPTVQELDALMPRPSTTPPQADIAAQTPPPAPPQGVVEALSPQPQESKPGVTPSRPPAMAKAPQFGTVSEPPSKMKFVAIAVVALILIVAGVWYFSPSANPPVGKPQGGLGTSQTGTGQQGPVVETPAPTSQSPTESETDTAGRRKQVEAAKRQGDNYYDNGEYDKAVDAYQGGLKLAPSNAQLLKALRRAQTAKAAEEKFNQ